MSYNEPPNYGSPPPGGGGYGGYGGQPPYGGQPYGGQPGFGGQPAGTSVLAIIGLVTGILGLIPCLWGCFVFSIAAVVLGVLGQNEVKQGKKTGKGLALAAIITGAIGIALSILVVVLYASGAIDFTGYSDFS